MGAGGVGRGTGWVETSLFQGDVGVAVVDIAGRYAMVNRALGELLGRAPVDLVGTSADALIPEYELGLVADHPEVLDDPTWTFRGERRLQAHGIVRWVDVHGSVTRTDAERPGMLCVVTDITRLKASEQVHQRLLDQLRVLLANTRELILLVDVQGRIVYSSSSSEETLQHTRQIRVGASVLDLFHPDDVDHVTAQLATARTSPAVPIDLACRVGDATDGWRHVRGTLTSRLEDPSVSGVVVSLLPAEDVHRLRGRIEQLEEMHRVLVAEAPQSTLVVAGDVIVFANQAAADLLGMHHPDDLVGTNPLDFVHADHRERAAARMGATDERPSLGEALIVRPDRSLLLVGVMYAPVAFHGSEAHHMVLWDVSRQRRTEPDSGQDLPDTVPDVDRRVGLVARVDRLLARVEPDRHLAVLWCELDDFEEIEDRLGDEVSDDVLREIGRRLRRAVRPGDLAVRVAGAEFVIVAEVGAHESAAAMAHRVLAAIAVPVEILGTELAMTASAGLTIGPAGVATGAELMERADAARFAARSSGPGTLWWSD